MKMKLGNRTLEAPYQDWEILCDELEEIFGEKAVEIRENPEKIDQLDVEIYYDRDIGTN